MQYAKDRGPRNSLCISYVSCKVIIPSVVVCILELTPPGLQYQ